MPLHHIEREGPRHARGVAPCGLSLVALLAACSAPPADAARDAASTGDSQPALDAAGDVPGADSPGEESPDDAIVATDVGPASETSVRDAGEADATVDRPSDVTVAPEVGDVNDGGADAASVDATADASIDTPADMTVATDVAPDLTTTPDVAPDVRSDVTLDIAPDLSPDVAPDASSPGDVVGDGPTSCSADERLCSGACVNTSTDVANCGGCGARCGAGRVCHSSVCQLPFTCTATDGRAYGPIAAMAADVTGDGTRTLASIMAVFPNATMLRTPGLSLAVREADGSIHAAVFGEAYNTAFDPAAPPLSPSTLFQAGSISKPVSASAYLLTETADATRTMDIRPTVASLVSPSYAITPADLLSHTAGTSVHGFGGYAPGLALPTVDQIVLGVRPANSPPVTFGTLGPWLYSGGGYLLWEAWLERNARRDLPSLVRERLFVPAGATRSTYQQPLPTSEHDAACGLDATNLPGRCRNVMPEYAAAGLWTTPTELTCIAGYLTSRRTDVLSRVQTRAVAISGYPQRQGLGFRHRAANGVDESAGHFYEHSGTNYGFCSTLVFFSDGRAIAAMDNSCAGVSAVVVRALCRRLGWTCAGSNFAAM